MKFTILMIKLAVLIFLPITASAYVGPGAGLGAIGTVLALIGAVLLGIAGFVWYPMKRFLSKNREKETQQETDLKAVDKLHDESEADTHSTE
jgi:hypothetical protein